MVTAAKPNDLGIEDENQIKFITNSCEMIYVYALLWSCGGNVDSTGRIGYDKLLKETIEDVNSKNGFSIPIPEESYYN